MLGVSAVFALAIELLLPQNRMRGLVLLLSVGGTCLIGMALLARGKVKTAGIGYLLLMWVIVSSLAITGGGVSSPAFAGFMCLALTGGLLFGMKGGVVMTALCLAAEAGIIFAGAWGLLPPSQVKHTPGTLAITHAIFLGWVGLIVVQYSRAIEAAAYNLGERVKELTALHAAAQALHDTKTGLREVLETFARLIPSAYQFPLHATARIRIGEMEATTWGFRRSTLMQRADFTTPDGLPGSIEVSYAGEFPGNARAPFLPEEQVLLNTLADMLRAASERRKADSALRESEARLRELFDTARDTIYHLSPQGTIVLLNPAFEAVTGWKRDEWTGRHFGELIHPEDLPRAVEYFRRAMAGRESPLYEVRVRTKAGGYVKAEFLGVPRRAENKVVGVLGVARDVTERRGLEEQAHRAQRLDSIGALAGGIAHDLNNILTPILLASEMLEKRVEDERGKGMAASIASSARRGSEIVKQILTFARGGAGGARAQQLRHLAREMETFVRETFPRGIEIRFDVARDLPPVMGDATQIHQVLLNLCVNARDAMPDGGRLVVTAAVERVAAADEDAMPGGDYVVLSAAAQGWGSPPRSPSCGPTADSSGSPARPGEGPFSASSCRSPRARPQRRPRSASPRRARGKPSWSSTTSRLRFSSSGKSWRRTDIWSGSPGTEWKVS
jgi:PAS domain S-box-containing protein